MESVDFILKLITIIAAIVSAYITTRVTLKFILKEVEQLGENSKVSETEINHIKLQLGTKISSDVAYSSFVTKEELMLHLDKVDLKLSKVELQQTNMLEKLSELNDSLRYLIKEAKRN